VAHRGWSSIAPENTLASYRLAIESGAELAECDVMLSSDGVPVLMHDDTVDRTTNGTGLVSSYTAAALAQLDAGAWKGEEWRGEGIPTLEAALRLVAGKLRFVIEIKEAAAAPQVLQAIRNAHAEPDELMIFSFALDAVATIARAEPMLPTTWLIDEVPLDPEGRRRVLRKALSARVSAVGVSYRKAYPALIRAAHERGLLVFTWTVNDPKDMRRMIEMGVDAIISDYPDVALKLVGGP
jgi:glycerophosphoryl diester phosphodiesterase